MSPSGGSLRRAARESALFLFFLALAVAATWPLARLLPVAVAYPGDPLINTYILAWDVHAMATGLSQLFHAGIFHPSPYALTFSENLFGLWPFAAILLPLTSPLTTHNVLLILGIAFSGYGAAVLGRLLTGSTAGGIVSGVAYGFCAWRFVHLSHLQHAWGGWLPLLIAAMVLYAQKPTWRAAVLAGLAFAVNGFTNLHYLVFGLVAIAIVLPALFLSSPERRNLSFFTPLAVSFGAATIVLVAALWPYRIAHELYDVRGSIEETTGYSAAGSDWITTRPPEEPERRVHPGQVAIVLALVGAFLSLRTRRQEGMLWPLVALLLVAIGILFSLGLRTTPYETLFELSSLFRGIRAPARWAVLAYLGLAMLAAFVVRVRLAWTVGLAASALLLFEVWQAPVRWYLMPSASTPVYAWLSSQKSVEGVLELPIGERDYYYLYDAARHHRPLVNGASGGAPAHYMAVRTAFARPEIGPDVTGMLKSSATSHVIVHADVLGPEGHAIRKWISNELSRGALRYVGHFESGIRGDFVFAFDGASKPQDEALARFLAADGTIPFNQLPFGYLEAPLPIDRPKGALKVRGWALSGVGVRSVRLWFANKACFVDTDFVPYPAIQRLAPFHSTASARFQVDLPGRPCGGVKNDILVEITDHAGRTATLPHVWLDWE